VEEAYRLISKSVIRVDTAEIEFDQGPEFPEEEDVPAETATRTEVTRMADDGFEAQSPERDESSLDAMDSDGEPHARNRAGSQSATSSTLGSEPSNDGSGRKKVRISYDAYRAMARSLMCYLKEAEEQIEDEGAGEPSAGIRRTALVEWYMAKQDEDKPIESMAMAEEEAALVDSVIGKLITVSLLGFFCFYILFYELPII